MQTLDIAAEDSLVLPSAGRLAMSNFIQVTPFMHVPDIDRAVTSSPTYWDSRLALASKTTLMSIERT